MLNNDFMSNDNSKHLNLLKFEPHQVQFEEGYEHELNEMFAKLSQKLQSQTQHLISKAQKLKQAVKIYRQKNEVRDKQIYCKEVNIKRRGKRMKEMERQIEPLEEKNAILGRECHQLKEQINQANKRLKKEQLILTEETNELQAIRQKHQKAHQELNQLQIDFNKSEYPQFQIKYNIACQQSQQLLQCYNEKLRNLQEHQKNTHDQEHQCRSLQIQLDQQQLVYERLKAKVKQSQKYLKQLQKVKQQRVKHINDMAEMQQIIKELQLELGSYNQKIVLIQAENARIRHCIVSKESKISQLQATYDRIKATTLTQERHKSNQKSSILQNTEQKEKEHHMTSKSNRRNQHVYEVLDSQNNGEKSQQTPPRPWQSIETFRSNQIHPKIHIELENKNGKNISELLSRYDNFINRKSSKHYAYQ